MAKIESLHGTTPAEIFQSGLENIQRSGHETVETRTENTPCSRQPALVSD